MTRTVGTAVAQALLEARVEAVFGVPGVHTLEYYRGFAAAGVRTILARHEGGAAFMADGYARASGRPAACCVITGPGLTNAATGVGQARADSVPMLVLTSATPLASRGAGRGLLHELPRQLAILEQVCGHAREATTAPAAVRSVPELLADATSGRPRPVGLQIPTDVLAAPAPAPGEAKGRAAPPAQPDATSVATALHAARAACLVIGGGVVKATAEVRALIEALALPVITTVAAKGVLPEGHPLLAGAVLSRAATHKWLLSRDLVLALGTELSETDTEVDPLPLPRLIRVDLEPTHGAAAAEETFVPADAGAFARALLASWPANTDRTARSAAEAAELRAAATAPAPEERPLVEAIGAVHRGLGDARVYSDMTQLAYVGNWAYPVNAPRTWLHPSGFGSLGFALPAAIGGTVAEPDRPTAVIVGDGGLMYTVAELMTATELDAALVVVVWDNGALGQIRDDMVRRGIPPISVTQRNPELEALGRACGFAYARPGSDQALTAALQGGARRRIVHLRRELFA